MLTCILIHNVSTCIVFVKHISVISQISNDCLEAHVGTKWFRLSFATPTFPILILVLVNLYSDFRDYIFKYF